MDKEAQAETINLQLGDIIQIIAASDADVNGKQFLISYLDKTRIELKNADGVVRLTITPEGSLSNEAITGISILSRAENPGYARQNGLVTKQWINIYFAGDLPTIMTGEITSLEEDQIEVTLIEGDVIYIDFAYKGLPDDLPIEKITIRGIPDAVTPSLPIAVEKQVADLDDDLVMDEEVFDASAPVEATPVFKERVKEILFDADQLQFGEELGVVRHMVQVPDQERRYGIDKQTTDLLNELLSDVPNAQRTELVLNNIHRMIERFKQLRTEFSKFDAKGNADKPELQGADFKPLVERLEKLNQRLYWILPVVKSRNKVYDVENGAEEEPSIEPETLAAVRTAESEVLGAFKSGSRGYDYMVKQMSEFWTPFISAQQGDGVITSQHVATNINSLVNTLGDFQSFVVSNGDLKRKRFLVQRYNLGQNTLMSQRIKGGGVVVKVKELTRPDEIAIESFLTLKRSAVTYSQVDLPATDIMRRSDLARFSLSYWRMLNKLTSVSSKQVIPGENIDFDKSTYLRSITNFKPTDGSNISYKEYLDSIIPKTRILFDLVKDDIRGKLSIQAVLDSLQPFLIYQRDLSFMQYLEMTDFIVDKITEFKRSYVVAKRAFEVLITQGSGSKRRGPELLRLPRLPRASDDIVDSYDLERLPIREYTNNEFLALVNDIDYGRFFNNVIAFMGSNLLSANGMQELEDTEAWISANEKNVSPEEPADCSRRVLTKKYLAMDELEEDNGKSIIFDRVYDGTFYDIIEEYAADIAAVEDNKKKILIIAEKLKENNGMSDADAFDEAEAMVLGARPVKDGHYAVVVFDDSSTWSPSEGEKRIYFKRRDNTWVRDESVGAESGDEAKIFCNLKQNCISIKDSCDSFPEASADIKTNMRKEMLDEFTKNLQINAQEISKMIDNELDNSKSRLIPLIKIRHRDTLKYDTLKHKLGLSASDLLVEKSPRQPLLDLILGQGDFVKRQTDISRFVAYYTRPAGPEEDRWWLYCLSSGVKLLPTFVAKLADSFVKGDDYFHTLQRVVAEQGDESGDGESIVDRYSRWIITRIDFSTDEGYTAEGFLMRTRDVLEADIGTTLAQAPESEPKQYENKEAETVFKVVNATSKFMGIDPAPIMEFIIGETTKLLAKTMSSEVDYNAAIAAATASGSKKKFDPYEKTYNRTLLLYTIGFFLVAIQTSVPAIRTRKTYPGCVRSFNGYPCGATADKSALEYLICVAKGISSPSVEPWAAIAKMPVAKITSQLSQFLDKFIIPSDTVQVRMHDRETYNATKVVDEVPEEVSIKQWTNFLPPLRPVKVGAVAPPSAEWQKTFTESLKSGKKIQDEMVNALRSKLIYLALSVEEEIENVVKKNVTDKKAALSNSVGEPFLENACCNDGSPDTYEYFVSKAPTIERTNSIVRDLRSALDDIDALGRAPILFDPENTRVIYPPIPAEFSEETIYRAFIVYCKYNSNVAVSEELRAVCMAKPDDFDVNASIGDKIRALKRDGRNFDNKSLAQLMSIINMNNIVDVDYKRAIFSNLQILRERLNSMEEREDNALSQVFRQKMLNVLDSFSDSDGKKDSDVVRDFKNYLSAANKQMAVQLGDFVTRNAKADSSSKKRFRECISELPIFPSANEGDPLAAFRCTEFMKNALQCLVRVFPNIVINKVNYSNVKVPKHWKLSDRHNTDISAFISEHYTQLQQFYGDDGIAAALNLYQREQIDTMILAWDTMYLAPTHSAGSSLNSVFDSTMVTSLFSFYFLSLLVVLTKLSTRESLLKSVPARISQPMIAAQLQVVDIEVGEAYEPTIAIMTGQQKEMAEKLADVCLAFTSLLCKDKDAVDYDYDTLSERITRAKEKEKDAIVDYLTNITDEQRDIEKRFKQHKLGERWGIGQQKGFRVYDEDTYDREREENEKRAILERRIGNVDGVTEGLLDVFVHDREAADQVAEEIDAEEYHIELGEDNDDYGDPDDNNGF